jgi:hypothetical protein
MLESMDMAYSAIIKAARQADDTSDIVCRDIVFR